MAQQTGQPVPRVATIQGGRIAAGVGHGKPGTLSEINFFPRPDGSKYRNRQGGAYLPSRLPTLLTALDTV